MIISCACAGLFFPAGLHATEHKQVLIIQSRGREYSPWNEYAKQIRAELDRRSPWPLDVREQPLETRSGNLNPELPFVEYLEVLYSDHSPDLIVVIGAPAAAFIQRHRDELFPTAPVLFTAIEQRRLKPSGLTHNDAVVAATVDFRGVFESFLQIAPDTKIVAVVNGHSPTELFWRNEVQKELRPLKDRIDIRWYDNLSFQEILEQTASLPPHSAIFWGTMVVDATGAAYEGDSALTKLHATANAPIFTYDDAFFGQGIVGGPMLSALALSKEAGAVAVRMLGGEKPSGIKTELVGFARPKYDWRELQRWGISESRLPSNSEIYFRKATAWDQYRLQILGAFALILLQGLLISALLLERGRRIRAEAQASKRTAELAHINRYSIAGELTATIAHELNQPLGAILTNAEVAELMVKSQSPDLREIGEILADIRRDDERASEVIVRLRSLLNKAPFELKYIDANEVVRETARLLSAWTIARGIDLTSFIAPTPLPIKGDFVQLQQVVVNLVVNAADAMSSMPSKKPRITISTARDGDSAALLVSDVGPGIPVAKLKEIFELFFTTKREGMGMGLSIARTIVEAHGGQLSAENNAGRGATFRVRLPLSLK